MTKSEKLATLRAVEGSGKARRGLRRSEINLRRAMVAAMTIKEFELLPEQEREEAHIGCPYCGKEIVGRLFCNPVHRERYRERWRRNYGWLGFRAREKAEGQPQPLAT